MGDITRLRQDIVFESTLREQHLVFHSTWGIFSPRAIDKGTIMLLDYLEISQDPMSSCIGIINFECFFCQFFRFGQSFIGGHISIKG